MSEVESAAEHRLLAKQVGLALFAEAGLDDAGAAAADGRGIGQADFVRAPRGILLDCQQAGHAGTTLVLGAHRVTGTLGRDHEDVEVGARLDQVEVDGQAVGESQSRALLEVVLEIILVEIALQLVGCQHHDHVGPFGRLGRGHYREAGAFGLGRAARARAQGHRNVLDAAVAQVVGVGVALAAVADDDDLLGLDQIEIGVTIVKHAHGVLLRGGGGSPLS